LRCRACATDSADKPSAFRRRSSRGRYSGSARLLSQSAAGTASLPFVQSPENLEQVPVWQVRDIQSVHFPDGREHVADLDVIVPTKSRRLERSVMRYCPGAKPKSVSMKSSTISANIWIPVVEANSTRLPLNGPFRTTRESSVICWPRHRRRRCHGRPRFSSDALRHRANWFDKRFWVSSQVAGDQ
jgi:hypothetical protein